MKLALASALVGTLASSHDGLPPWLDQVSRVGVAAILMLALVGLHRRWWVPGWAYQELLGRHAALRDKYDAVVEIALATSRGVERSATVLEEALVRGRRERGR